MTGGYGKGKKIVSDQCRLLSTTQRAHSNHPEGFPFLASAWSVVQPHDSPCTLGMGSCVDGGRTRMHQGLCAGN